jgi:hypothetical protein
MEYARPVNFDAQRIYMIGAASVSSNPPTDNSPALLKFKTIL